MNRPILRRHARAIIWLAAVVVSLAALSPTLNAWRTQGQPKLFAELCTATGIERVALDGSATSPAKPAKHGAECAWCLSPASFLALTGADTLQIPAIAGGQPAAVLNFASVTPLRQHAFAWAQAPPAVS